MSEYAFGILHDAAGRDREVAPTEESQVNLQYACGNQEIGIKNPSHKKKQRLVTKTLHTQIIC